MQDTSTSRLQMDMVRAGFFLQKQMQVLNLKYYDYKAKMATFVWVAQMHNTNYIPQARTLTDYLAALLRSVPQL